MMDIEHVTPRKSESASAVLGEVQLDFLQPHSSHQSLLCATSSYLPIKALRVLD
jgi:hypothetical protein